MGIPETRSRPPPFRTLKKEKRKEKRKEKKRKTNRENFQVDTMNFQVEPESPSKPL
jgi:hypothetical protein